MRLRSCLRAAVLIAAAVTSVCTQTTAVEGKLDRLPPELRERGRAILAESDDRQRARMAQELATVEPEAAMEFLMATAADDESAVVRRTIVNRLGRYSHPRVKEMLRRLVVSAPDDDLALLALKRLRLQTNQDMRLLLKQRLESARAEDDVESRRRLAEEDELWASLARGAMLPGFLKKPPPLFTAKSPDEPVRVLAFGDFGDGSETQRQVATAMLDRHRSAAADFGITVGDNFYDNGVKSLDDAYWQDRWEALYSPLGIRFYPSLGNHDWGYPDSPAAQILYSNRSTSWRMPAAYYTYTAGPVQFFALDTTEMSAAQLLWLEQELERSRARWKVVYGHNPIYSAGVYKDEPRMIEELLPLLRGKADIYFAGHDHDMQHLKPDGGVHFFVVGGGGAGLRQPDFMDHSLFADAFHGFAVLEADDRQWRVMFFGSDGAPAYDYSHK